MPPVFREDPYGGYNFEVIVNDISPNGAAVRGSFMEASGLEAEQPPIEYRNGTDLAIRKLPGFPKFTNITLKRGIIGDLAFWNWILAGMKGQVQRKNGSIVLLDENRQEVTRWNFKRGWPCKWTGPGLNAKNNEVAMETLEICHEGLSTDGEA